MAIQSISSIAFPTATSVEVPESANFIGSVEDALVFQSLILNVTTDRLREAIQRNLGPAGDSIAKIEAFSSALESLARFAQTSQLPITYGALQASDKTAISLRLLFAKDGPNLGDSLEKSQAALAELAANGVTLNAPKMTPVMTEQFTAVGGKVDFTKSPSGTSVGWRSELELAAIDPGTAPGSFPGSVVKTIESRDAAGKLVSVTRYTVFIDYANLRPKAEDLNKQFSAYTEKIRSTLDDLVLRLADTLKNESVLNQRAGQESSRIQEDQKLFFLKEQEKTNAAFESIRLFRILYLQINSLRALFEQKVSAEKSLERITDPNKPMISEGVVLREFLPPQAISMLDSFSAKKNILPDADLLLDKSNTSKPLISEGIKQKKFFPPKEINELDSSSSKKNTFPDVGLLSDFRNDVSSLKSLLSALNKVASNFSDSIPNPN